MSVKDAIATGRNREQQKGNLLPLNAQSKPYQDQMS